MALSLGFVNGHSKCKAEGELQSRKLKWYTTGNYLCFGNKHIIHFPQLISPSQNTQTIAQNTHG